MSSFLESFFDDGKNNFKLWSKDFESLNYDVETRVFAGPMHKLSRKTGHWKERFFVLTNQHLVYYKDSTEGKIRGIMNLSWVRNEYLMDGHPTNKDYHFGVRFIKNMKYSDLWIKDEAWLKQWKSALSLVCLQSDFHIKFNAIKMIGKGSFARVYLVENKDTKLRFAVKAFSKDYLLSQNKGKESLINEIEIMRELSHEYVMKLEEVHESQNSIYLVMELLEGGELFNYVYEKGKLQPKEYHKILKCLLEALAYMDSKGIMHRDLKPENMILKGKDIPLEENRLKLVDFGLATKYAIKEYLFKRCGTPGFVAPEVINAPSNQNIHYDAKCDVFSAGIIFYLLLTGQSPFEGKSFQEILNKNKASKIDFNHKALHKIADSTLDLLKKMLNVNPKSRPSSAECLTHDFFIENDNNPNVNEIVEDGISENLKHFQEKYKFNVKSINRRGKAGAPMPDFSMEFRAPLINGRTDTVKDSVEFSSKNKINSINLNSPHRKGKGSSGKRESIYKHALMQQLKNANLSQFSGRSSVNSEDDSDESVGENPKTKMKKSRFGQS